MREETYADLLLFHMRTCKACVGAKVARTYRFCLAGRTLIKLTLKERHG